MLFPESFSRRLHFFHLMTDEANKTKATNLIELSIGHVVTLMFSHTQEKTFPKSFESLASIVVVTFALFSFETTLSPCD